MAVKLQQVTNLMNKLAPSRLAYDWDNVGLQLGSYNQEVSKVLVSLDVDQEVLDEAINKNVDLIIVHHPVIFKGISNLRFNTPLGRLLQQAIKHDVAIYVTHTNYDIAKGGLNDYLAEKLELQETEILQVTDKTALKKLVVFVPDEALAEVKRSMAKAGAGHIGNYSNSFFAQQGVGSFKPLNDTDPYIGTKGKINKVKEQRLETIISENKLNSVVKRMIKAHPYEEVAYDIYSLDNQGAVSGIGRIGYLSEEIILKDYIELLKTNLFLDKIKLVGDIKQKIKKVALCSGSGADFIKTASFKGADLLVTGDIKYHEAQLALEEGLVLIDAGHYGTEVIMKEAVTAHLKQEVSKNKLNVEVLESQVNTNPFQIV